jgi:hypothetical protein
VWLFAISQFAIAAAQSGTDVFLLRAVFVICNLGYADSPQEICPNILQSMQNWEKTLFPDKHFINFRCRL